MSVQYELVGGLGQVQGLCHLQREDAGRRKGWRWRGSTSRRGGWGGSRRRGLRLTDGAGGGSSACAPRRGRIRCDNDGAVNGDVPGRSAGGDDVIIVIHRSILVSIGQFVPREGRLR